MPQRIPTMVARTKKSSPTISIIRSVVRANFVKDDGEVFLGILTPIRAMYHQPYQNHTLHWDRVVSHI